MAGFFSAGSWDAPIKLGSGLPKCGECGLSKKCYSPFMKVAGTGEYSVLFVGDAPSESDDRVGQPFSGDAGKYLRRVVSQLGFDMNECLMTNSIICKPGKMEWKFIDCCKPNLTKTIQEKKPKVIILLGTSAVENFITNYWERRNDGITQWVGSNIPIEEYGAWVCPTYHPNDVVDDGKEDPVLAMMMRDHIQKAFSLLNVPLPGIRLEDLKKKIEIIKTTDRAIERLVDLNDKKGRVSFDYETTSIKPDNFKDDIVCSSFCFKGRDCFSFMVNEQIKPYMSKVLLNADLKKSAYNLKFEERWSKAKLGHGIVNWEWDGMLASHVLNNKEGITGLKFQAFVMFGIHGYEKGIDFENIRSNNVDDLLIYNGLDSLIESMVQEKQKEIFHESSE